MMREPRGRVQQSILEVLDHQSGLATPKLAASVYGARIPSPAQYAAVRRALCNLRSTGAVISWRGEGRALRWKVFSRNPFNRQYPSLSTAGRVT